MMVLSHPLPRIVDMTHQSGYDPLREAEEREDVFPLGVCGLLPPGKATYLHRESDGLSCLIFEIESTEHEKRSGFAVELAHHESTPADPSPALRPVFDRHALDTAALRLVTERDVEDFERRGAAGEQLALPEIAWELTITVPLAERGVKKRRGNR